MNTNQWTEADYDGLSWHDNHVHGMEIRAGEHDTGYLILHLDYILEWRPPVDGRYSFVIAPATLHFREVSGLSIELDYLRPGAAITPFSIAGIGREEIRYSAEHASWRWTIAINWPEGVVKFEAPGFVQELVGRPIVSDEQCLSHDQRERLRLNSPITSTKDVIQPPESPPTVRLDGSAITDWESFHDLSLTAFGFPQFYGRNMNAWIDCLTYIREGDGMSRFALGPRAPLVIELADSGIFKELAPEIFGALIECIEAVNHRHVDVGEVPPLHLLLL